jgi:aspartyl/asparaginyl beta-hydroxylase (cupin superfamily)
MEVAVLDVIRRKLVAVSVWFGERILMPIEWWMARASRVGDRTFFVPEEFPWIREIEAEWGTIREELDAVLDDREDLPNFQDISVDQHSLTSDDNWKTYFLYGFGFKAERNCAACPETTRLVEAIPGMKTAFFSILSPHKHIPDHRGPYKGVLRYHLGLRIPEPREQCRIRVGEDVRHWEEGRSLVFDDTFNHEAWNDTDGVRVVLFVDFVRPLRQPAAAFNAIVLKAIAWSPFVRDAKRRQDAWEQRFERLKARRTPARV